MTEQEKHIRELVKATLTVYEGLPRAEEALKKLHPELPDINLQEPVVVPGCPYLMDEALSWVANETGFRYQKDGESGTEWLQAYLEEEVQ